MVVFSKLAVLAGTAAAGRDLFQAPVNPGFLSQTRPAQAYPAQAYPYGLASPDVRMVAQPTASTPVYMTETEDASQGWMGTVLGAAAVGAACGAVAQSSKNKVRGRAAQVPDSGTPTVAHLAGPISALALKGTSAQLTKKPETRAGEVQMFQEGDIGVLPPLGVYDPLGLIETRDMRRFEIMEIKHGRAAMLGFLHVIAIEAGVRVPGYLSTSQDLKFRDVPAGCFASLEAIPTAGWLQIMLLTCMQETGMGFASKPQYDDAEAGDIALDGLWVRYDDPEVRTFKLNVERQNGRAAMLGMTGCLIHELLGVDALYPTGGMGGAAPPPIVAALAVEGKEGTDRAGDIKMQSGAGGETIADLEVLARKLNPIVGYYDPLNLAEGEFWDQSNEATIGFLRHAEIKHGRVAMAGFVGFLVHANGIHFPWKIPGDEMCAPGVSPPLLWQNIPEEAKLQIILTIGIFEIYSEVAMAKGPGMGGHYMRGGKPGLFPAFKAPKGEGKNGMPTDSEGNALLPHPVPLNLYDPFNFNKNRSDEWKAEKLQTEINNGRLAQIGLMSLLSEGAIPGSVPFLKGLIPASGAINVMRPFDFLADAGYLTGAGF